MYSNFQPRIGLMAVAVLLSVCANGATPAVAHSLPFYDPEKKRRSAVG